MDRRGGVLREVGVDTRESESGCDDRVNWVVELCVCCLSILFCSHGHGCFQT